MRLRTSIVTLGLILAVDTALAQTVLTPGLPTTSGTSTVTGGAPMLGTGSSATVPAPAVIPGTSTVTGGAPMLGTGSSATVPAPAVIPGTSTVTGGAPMLGTGSSATVPATVPAPATGTETATTGGVPPVAMVPGAIAGTATSPTPTPFVRGPSVVVDYSPMIYAQMMLAQSMARSAACTSPASGPEPARGGGPPSPGTETPAASQSQTPPRVSIYDVAGGRAALDLNATGWPYTSW
jgi:hypothetical protein